MLASELITALQTAITEYGDRQVVDYDYDEITGVERDEDADTGVELIVLVN